MTATIEEGGRTSLGQSADTPHSSAVVVENLSVSYRSAGGHVIPALEDVTLNVSSGSWTALIGPSGSGKSTLLHVIGGLQRPSAGVVDVSGNRLDLLTRGQLARFRLAHIGFVFQSFQLLAYLAAWENVALPLVAVGIPPTHRRRRAMQILDEVGLKDRAHHRPGELSGGEQQRVALARAAVNHPDILLADEPTGNLDATSAKVVLDILSGFVRRGTAVVCATHDVSIAGEADRQVHLSHGRATAGAG